jgi:putative membrane protein
VVLSLSCPIVVLTLGLFIFVLNGLMLWLTAVLSGALGFDFRVTGPLAAILGALVLGITSSVLNLLVGNRPKR